MMQDLNNLVGATFLAAVAWLVVALIEEHRHRYKHEPRFKPLFDLVTPDVQPEKPRRRWLVKTGYSGPRGVTLWGSTYSQARPLVGRLNRSRWQAPLNQFKR